MQKGIVLLGILAVLIGFLGITGTLRTSNLFPLAFILFLAIAVVVYLVLVKKNEGED